MKFVTNLLLIAVLLFSCTQKTDERSLFSSVRPQASPALENSSEPHLVTHAGKVYMSWLETHDTTTVFKYATLSDDVWSGAVVIDSGSSWFVNWADYPTLAVNNETFIAHYLDQSGPGKYSYDVKYVVANTGQWSEPRILNDDGKEAEHGFVSIVPYDENFFVTWLDGRNASMEGMDHDDHEGHGAMSLRAAILDKTGEKLNEWLLDDRVCDCCQTSAAITSNGPVVVYRDRSDDEVRDMSIVRWENDRWTEPLSVYADHWMINGCPVNGPRISAVENNMAVAWFTAPDDSTQVKVAFSANAGATFGKPVLLNRKKTSGRVDVELIGENAAVVSWIENDSIQVAKVNASGAGIPQAIAAISRSRSSGFPQMTKAGNRLVFAWTDVSSGSVKTASVVLR